MGYKRPLDRFSVGLTNINYLVTSMWVIKLLSMKFVTDVMFLSAGDIYLPVVCRLSAPYCFCNDIDQLFRLAISFFFCRRASWLVFDVGVVIRT